MDDVSDVLGWIREDSHAEDAFGLNQRRGVHYLGRWKPNVLGDFKVIDVDPRGRSP